MSASMTKRDFEAIAGVIRDTRREVADDAIARRTVDQIARELAGKFYYANPRFDRSRFLAACEAKDSFDMAGRAVRYSEMRPGQVGA